MITELTAEQQAQIPLYRDKWIEFGLSTERVDFEKAKAALELSYRSAGLEPPATILVAGGPREGKNIFRKHFPKADKQDFMGNIIYGSHEADWASYVDYFQQVVGLDLSQGNGLIELAKTSGWVWVGEDLAIIMDRPSSIRMDENDVLHAEDRPSVLYPDGFAVYSWHGQLVPREWIMERHLLTPAIALGQENVELRRAACEILGWNNILTQLNYVTIEADEDPEIGTLVEVDLPDAGPSRFLMVRCGTGREFALPVPPEMTTALQANSWTFGLEPEDLLNLEIRT